MVRLAYRSHMANTINPSATSASRILLFVVLLIDMIPPPYLSYHSIIDGYKKAMRFRLFGGGVSMDSVFLSFINGKNRKPSQLEGAEGAFIR